jgi:formylglycine-generating enzyme required for sulfatase activity
MLKSTVYNTILLICILLIQESNAQGVLAPYIKEAPSTTRFIRINLTQPLYITDDMVPEGAFKKSCNDFNAYLNNLQKDSLHKLTLTQKEFIARITYYRKYYEKPPLEFKECTYYNPAFSGVDNLIRGFNQYATFIMPEAFRFYSIPINDTTINHFDLKLKLSKPLYELMEPFYFKKTAITNKEYREFVEWVKDSLAHLILAEDDPTMVMRNNSDIDPPLINWKTKINLSDSNVIKELTEAGFYKSPQERFYQRIEIDTRRLNYLYYFKDASGNIIKKVVNIYPDTLVWVNDFPYSSMEPMTNMYFWHPAYNDYPVVGISKLQAIAYLNWKTIQEQKELNKEGKGQWAVSYELPTEYEWEMVETADRTNNQPDIYPLHYSNMSDYSFITNLSFRPNADIISFSFHDSRDSMNTKHQHGEGEDESYTKLARYTILQSFTSSGAPLTLNSSYLNGYNPPTRKADLTKSNKGSLEVTENYDCNGISFMGSNVSEWMQETYKDNWKPVYDYRHKLLEQLGGKDSKLILTNEEYFNAANDTSSSSGSASLVRGANWYDDRTGCKAGKNIEGMNAKAFVNPDSSYSALGFRYAIKIHRRDEMKLVDSAPSNLK